MWEVGVQDAQGYKHKSGGELSEQRRVGLSGYESTAYSRRYGGGRRGDGRHSTGKCRHTIYRVGKCVVQECVS